MKNLSFSLLVLLGFSASLALADDFVSEDEEQTGADTFVIGSQDTGSDISLQFGTVLAESLQWDATNTRFVLSGDLDLAASQLINTRLENLATAPTCDGTTIGRVYYDTAQNAPFICDGTAWAQLGTVDVQPLASARYRDNSTTNINAAALDNLIPWGVEDFEDSLYTHDIVTNNSRVQVGEASRYLVSGSINVANNSTNNFRYNGRVKFRINGTTTLNPTFQPGYIRNNGGHTETSLVFSIVLDLAANDYFEILVDRENTTVGPANMIAGTSSMSIVQLQSVSSASSGGGGAPFVDGNVDLLMQPSTTQTLTITGTNFLPTSTVNFPGFGGTINSTTVVGPTQIDVNVTSDAVQATYDIVVDNSGTDNTTWPGNGVGQFEVVAITGTGPAGTYTESFEASLGNWADAGLDVAWTRDSGGTPSGGTGPTGGSAGVFYVFTEASNPNFPNVTFGLETTNFNVAQDITFDYHMFGAAMGTLELQTGYQGTFTTRFTLSGQQQAAQGDAYTTQFVDLSSFPVEVIRFRYTSGANFTGDCTLDNISIVSI